MSLHIVTCAPNYLPHLGGAEVGLHTLLRHCRSSTNHRFSVIAGTTDQGLPREESIDGVEVHRFRWPSRSANWYAPTASSLWSIPFSLRRLEPDVVHLSYALPSGPGGWLGATMASSPYVLSVGGNDVADPVYPPPRPLQAVAAGIGRRAHHVICWTSPIRDAIVGEWGVELGRTSVNPFGVDTGRFSPLSSHERDAARARWGCTRSGRLLLGLQRLEARKGVDVLLDAAVFLRDAGIEFELLIGGTGREEHALKEQCTTSWLTDHVRFLGSVPEEQKPELMAMVDLFVLPSRYEGQGITLAEAAASGTPVVATNAGGTVDMVKPRQSGLLVPPDDPLALADAIAEAMSDDRRLSRWGHFARQHALDELSLSTTAQRFVDVVEDAAR